MEKPTLGKKSLALLASGRVANLPTVWSNVLVGFWIASTLIHDYQIDHFANNFRFWLILFTSLAASCLYVGGCMLGDYRDIHYDQQHRPERPLPSGTLSPTTVSITAWCLILSGILLTALSPTLTIKCTGVAHFKEIYQQVNSEPKIQLILLQIHEIIIVSLLAVSIITYAFIHKKKRSLALILMASCRALLVFLAIASAFKTFLGGDPHQLTEKVIVHSSWIKPWTLVLCGAVGAYTLLLSWVASTESSPSRFSFRKTLGTLLLILPLLSYLLVPLTSNVRTKTWWTQTFSSGETIVPATNTLPHISLLILTLAWIMFCLLTLKHSKPRFVSHTLAGFCLLDACLVAPFAPSISLICLAFFGIALTLQKITPAT